MITAALLAKVFAALFGISEVTGLSNKIKANSVCQLLFNAVVGAYNLIKGK